MINYLAFTTISIDLHSDKDIDFGLVNIINLRFWHLHIDDRLIYMRNWINF